MSTKKNHENKIIKKYENKTVKNRNIKKSYLSKLIKKTVCKSNIKPFEREYEKINKTIDERNKNINDTLVKLLRKKTVPKGILPNNDFYTYINYEWIKYTKVDTQKEGYIVQLDDFRLVQNKVFYELIDIILNYIKKNKNELSKQISNVYQSGIKLLDDNQAKNHLNNYINFYNLNTKMRDNMGLWRFLGVMNKNDIISFGLPLVFGLNPDLKDSKIFRCTMNQPILSIIDIKVYFDDGNDVSYKKDYKKRFFNYIDQMFEKFFGKNNNFKAR
jgi:predicted metalloendopeptidase